MTVKLQQNIITREGGLALAEFFDQGLEMIEQVKAMFPFTGTGLNADAIEFLDKCTVFFPLLSDCHLPCTYFFSRQLPLPRKR
jgi:hypothetical protein